MFHGNVCTYAIYDFIKGQIHNTDTGKNIDEEIYLSFFTDKKVKFEIISEEDKKIDIQEIEEINIWSGYNRDDAQNIAKNTQKINELIKAIKQLDKKMK